MPKRTTIKFRTAEDEAALFKRAAHSRGLSLSAWIRMELLNAADRILSALKGDRP